MVSLSRLFAALPLAVVGVAGCAGSPPPVVPAPSVVRCGDAIDVEDAPPAGSTVLAGAVAMMAGVELEAYPDGAGSSRLFAKSGLLVRAGTAVELRIVRPVVDGQQIGWGNPGQPDVAVSVPACPGADGRWLVFAGGYWADRPTCVQVEARTGDVTDHALVWLGRTC